MFIALTGMQLFHKKRNLLNVAENKAASAKL